jgi:hypothetical protein
MQEQGVSKLVSVKFHKSQETVAQPSLLVPPAAVVEAEPGQGEGGSGNDSMEVMLAK